MSHTIDQVRTGVSHTIDQVRMGVRLFMAYRVVSRLYFHLSVLYVFLLHHDHGVVTIAVVLASYGLAMTVATPLSRWAIDRIGLSNALVIGELLKAVGLVALALGASSVPVAIVAQMINAAGFSLGATADPPSVSRLVGGDAVAVGKLQSSAQSLMFLAVLVSGVAGGLLYLVDPAMPVVAAAAAALVAAGIAGALGSELSGDSGDRASPPGVAGATDATDSQRLLPAERVWVTYYVLTRGFMLGAFVGLLPYLLFVIVETSIVGLAMCLAAFSLAAFVAARYVGVVLARVGTTAFAITTAVVLVTAFAVFGLTLSLWPAVGAMALMGAASGGVRPITMTRLSAIAGQQRGGRVPAMVVSKMELSFGLCNAVVILGGGLLIAYASVGLAMLTAIAAYLVMQLGTALLRKIETTDHRLVW